MVGRSETSNLLFEYERKGRGLYISKIRTLATCDYLISCEPIICSVVLTFFQIFILNIVFEREEGRVLLRVLLNTERVGLNL